MDMLIRLYALDGTAARPQPGTFSVRKPLCLEQDPVIAWVADRFGSGWASEARAAFGNRPATLFVAIRGEPTELVGFCCYDAVARGFVGPIGVADDVRGGGVGAALLQACLHDMRSMGYGYAVAGAVGAAGFFASVAGGTVIDGSETGIYAGRVKG